MVKTALMVFVLGGVLVTASFTTAPLPNNTVVGVDGIPCRTIGAIGPDGTPRITCAPTHEEVFLFINAPLVSWEE
jgi:hypothetical protein